MKKTPENTISPPINQEDLLKVKPRETPERDNIKTKHRGKKQKKVYLNYAKPTYPESDLLAKFIVNGDRLFAKGSKPENMPRFRIVLFIEIVDDRGVCTLRRYQVSANPDVATDGSRQRKENHRIWNGLFD